MGEMSEELRDRMAVLETKHEERHRQTQGTLARIATAVETIASNQNKMEHLGAKVDRCCAQSAADHDRLSVIETRQSVLWWVLGVVTAGVVGAIIKAWG